MAEFGLKDFLTNYYYQMQFASMWAEPMLRARFESYVKNRDFVGKMKDWLEVDELMNVDRSTTPHTYTPKTNIVDAELKDEDFAKLYNMFHQAFGYMDADKKSLLYNRPAQEFLNQWFGPGKLFSLTSANSRTETGLDKLAELLTRHPLLKKHIAKNKIAGLETEDDVDSFIQKLNTRVAPDAKKYNSDGKLRQKITLVRDALIEILSYNTFQPTTPEYQAVAASKNELEGIEFEQRANPQKLQIFKNDYKNLLNTLFHSKKIRDAFANYGGDITKYIDKAKEHIPYDKENEPEFIPPKNDDELNWVQRIEKWSNDTYSDYFKKYLRLCGDRLFFSDYAKHIFKAVDKEKIKPQDGLGAILDKADAIKKRIAPNSKNAAEHFDWFVKTLSAIKNDKPKAFAGALQHGGQMRAIVSEIIMRAVQSGVPGDIDKAKSSMELLASMQYGLFTSKTMDALKKVDVSIFSDKDLSWNKNKGMAMVSKAFDGTLKFVGLTVSYGITALANMTYLSGNTFGKHFQHGKHDKTGKRLAGQEQEWRNNNTTEKNSIGTQITQKQREKAQQESIANSIDERQERTRKNQYESSISHAETELENAQRTVLQWIETEESKSAPHAELDAVRNYVTALNTNGAPATPAPTNITDQNVKLMLSELRNKMIRKDNVHNLYDQRLQTANDKLQQFQDATETVATLNNQIADLQGKYDTWDDKHKNQYQELAKHWDMIQEGRMSHLGPMWNWRWGKASDKKIDVNTVKMNFAQRHAYQIAS